MFPGDNEYAENSDQELALVNAFATALINLGQQVVEERLPTVTLPPQPSAYRVGNGLCIRACKSLRSITSLAQFGAGSDIAVLLRSMFETFVAINFVLQDTVSLPFDTSTQNLDPDQRARIYAGFIEVNKLENLKRLQKSDHVHAPLKAIDHQPFLDKISEVERSIGPAWVARFRKSPRTYSGLNLARLSSVLGKDCDLYYSLLYGEQSASVHATDFSHHVQVLKTDQRLMAKWHEPIKSVRHSLFMAAGMFYFSLARLHHQFKFDGNVTDELAGGWRILYEMKDRFEADL